MKTPNEAALDALEVIRLDLIKKMNACRSSTEAKTLGETFRHVVSAILAIERFQ